MLRSTAILVMLSLVAVSTVPATATDGDGDDGDYVLNLIGMESEMPVPAGDVGHRIFVPLYGECRIDLHEDDEFRVEDGNCTDDARSGFALPDPDPEDDGVSSYRVYVRALGQPGGEATFQSCFEDEDGTWCSTEKVYLVRAAGFSPKQDISRESLTVCHDKDGDGVYEREQIFDDDNKDYYWKYDNNGLRLAQLRFVPDTPTDISGPCPAV